MGCSREDQSRLCAHRAAALVVGLGVVVGVGSGQELWLRGAPELLWRMLCPISVQHYSSAGDGGFQHGIPEAWRGLGWKKEP